MFDALVSLSSEFRPEWRIGLLGIPIVLVATIYPSGALVYSVAGAYAALSAGALYANRSMVSVPLLASVCLLRQRLKTRRRLPRLIDIHLYIQY